uniref:Seven transmembrane protein n=1 Tax=Clytia hemisphaerica TaxID=252671 RepID=A0A7M5X883_9CNID
MGLNSNHTQPLVKLMKASVYPTHVLPINQNTPTMDALIFSIVASSVSFFGLVLCTVVLVIIRTGHNAKKNLIITILVTICFVENLCFIFLWGNYYMFEDPHTRRQINRLLFIVCTGLYQMFVFSLVAMTTDRFIAFFKPFKYKKLVTRSRIFKYCCVTIFITVAVRAPFFIGWSSIQLGALFKIDISS